MKRYLILLILLLVAPLYAAEPIEIALSPAIVGNTVAAKATVAGNFCDSYSGLLCEDLEGAASCSDDANSNCRVAWTIDASPNNNGTVNNQYTGLAGTYSKRIDANVDTNTFIEHRDFTNTTPLTAFTLIKVDQLSSTADSVIVFALKGESGATHNCQMRVINTASVPYFGVGGGGGTAQSSLQLVQGTTYCMWLDYTDNTATTGCQLRAVSATCSGSPPSCTCTRPTDPIAQVTTSYTLGVDRLQLRAIDTTADVDLITFDNIKVRAGLASIGDSGANQ